MQTKISERHNEADESLVSGLRFAKLRTALLEFNPLLGFMRDPHWRQPQWDLRRPHLRQC